MNEQDPRPSPSVTASIILRSPAEEETVVLATRSDELPRGPTGKYEIAGEIAQGGIGVVLKGHDGQLGRDVAMKFLRRKHDDNPQMLTRFIEEAQIGGQLQHPGIVPVYELGMVLEQQKGPPARSKSRPFFSMKLIKGQTLAGGLRERKELTHDRRRFLVIFQQVCQTVAYAHARGVIHRDLKPSNVMLGPFGEVQVMDWGFAKVLSRGGTADECPRTPVQAAVSIIETVRSGSVGSDSVAGSVMGTPAYMAPEQARGDVEHLDERCDVFALGGILCEILTGVPPYTGADHSVLFAKASRADLREANARLEECGADPELIRLARSCLAPAKAARPRDAGAVAQEVSAYLTALDERARKAQRAAAAARVRADEERKARRLTLSLAVSILAIFSAAAGGWLWVRHQNQARAAQATSAAMQAMEEATLLRGQAEATNDVGAWTAAVSAARRADGLLGGPERNAELRRQVADLLTDLGARREAAERAAAEKERDRRMVARLEEIRLEKSNVNGLEFDTSRGDALYAAAFREHGIDLEQLSVDEAARAIARRAIRQELVVALDDWAWGGRGKRKQQTANQQRLVGIANLADPDSWRGRLRGALLPKDQTALRDLAKSRERDDLPLISWDLLGRALADFHAPEAETWMREAQHRFSGDFFVIYALAEYLGQAKVAKYDDAARFFTAALALRALRPQNAVVLNNLGWTLYNQGMFDEALAAWQQAIRIKPAFALAYSNLGMVLSDQGKISEAELQSRKAVELQPDSSACHHNLAIALIARGKLVEAEASARKAIALEPNSALARSNLGDCLRRQHRLAEAETEHRQAIALEPDDDRFFINLGRTLLDADRMAEAEAAFQQGSKLRPRGKDAYFQLVRLYLNQAKLREADAACRKLWALKPFWAETHNLLGIVWRRQRRLDAAIEAQREATRLNPASAGYRTNLAVALSDKGLYDDAVTEDREAIRLDPDLAQAYAHLLFCLGTKQQHADAVRIYEEAVQKKPALAEDPEFSFRYNAACSAAQAGCGKGKDAPGDDKARAVVRQKAIAWLRAGLARHATTLAKGTPAQRRKTREILQGWTKDADFAGVREKEPLSKLPAEEQAAWGKLWSEVGALTVK